MTGIPLTSRSRSNALARLEASVEPGQELDVLVIGGGITGAGIALDAATRGLSTVVVEAQDWAAGTSICGASAVIATYGAQVVDAFYVKDMFGLKLHAKTKQESLDKKLRQAIAEGAERAQQ